MVTTRIIIILTVLLQWCVGAYAQQLLDKDKMQGRWEVVKVEATLFSQEDEKELERKMLTARDSINRVSGMIPWSLWIRGGRCEVEADGRIERDSCRWESPMMLLWEPAQEPVRYRSWQYSFADADHLILSLPAIFYMDPQRKVAVKRQFVCTYGRKG